MWPFKSRNRSQPEQWGLDSCLFTLSPSDPFTIRQSVEGVLVTGATGSGKTSGVGQWLARSYLAAGYGGLVLLAKDERAMWESYCRRTGRLDDLRVFSPKGPLRMNFLDHELNRAGEGAGLTENIVNAFSELSEIADRRTGHGGNDEAYWRSQSATGAQLR